MKELLQVIYPTVERKPPELIKEENCHYLLCLAHEYQMAVIVDRCEDFIIKVMKTRKPNKDVIAELVFAQTYDLKKLKRASIELAQNLTLEELKNDQVVYDQIESQNLKEIMEGMIKRLQSQLNQAQRSLSYYQRR